MRPPAPRLRFAIPCLMAALVVASPGLARQVDRDAERWVRQTLARMTIEQKIGQLLVPSLESTYVSSDSADYDALVRLVHEQHAGGFLLFGGRERVPDVVNRPYATAILGQPLAAASLLNRLQAVASLPLLNAADFETGVGFRIEGATVFPRAMAFGAAGDERLAREAGRITALEARALGVHVNFAPIVDVNNNPRNPVINTRAFGEDPELVGRLATAYVEGLQSAGMIATLKHFPGHGDTDVDTHRGLATIPFDRVRLERLEWAPFRRAIAAGAGALMSAHIELPAVDPTPATPATFSRPIVTGVAREELGFDGLIYTDSMSMHAVSRGWSAGEAAVRAIQAGNDLVLHSPDPAAAFDALAAAVETGALPLDRLDASVRRVLTAKARVGLHRARAVSLDGVPTLVGIRAHQAVAQEASERSITLLRDERNTVPLTLPSDRSVLYLSILDYPAGWNVAAPSRTFIPELEKRWPRTTAVELSDRTPADELALVRAMARTHDAIVASVFVRAASYSGRMDLAEPLVELLRSIARDRRNASKPIVVVLFGNPYIAAALPEVPAMLLTYDFYDLPERSAVRALAGEIPIGGRLPVVLPGVAEAGSGLTRPIGPARSAR